MTSTQTSECPSIFIPHHSLLAVAEKIDLGIRDLDTRNPELQPLWQKPLLLEAYIALLRNPAEFHRLNFKIIAQLLCPHFLGTAVAIGALPETAVSEEDVDYLPEADI